MGWDNASTVAQEVKDPQRTYPRTMFWSVAAVAVVYIVPILAVGYSGVPSTSWSDGAWVSLAGGIRPWLAVPVLLTIMISVMGQVNSLTMSYSRMPLAMAEDHLAPSILRRVSANGSPWVRAVALRSHLDHGVDAEPGPDPADGYFDLRSEPDPGIRGAGRAARQRTGFVASFRIPGGTPEPSLSPPPPCLLLCRGAV